MHFERILLDVEAQRDFFSPGGSCYGPGSAAAARNVRRLFRWARGNRIPVISTVLRVRPRRRGPLAPVPHCVEGSDGEKRMSGALLPRHIDLGMRNSTDLPRDIFGQYQQVILEKRHTDIFLHARAERLLTELDADTLVVCGAGSARGVAEAVIGLRHRRFKIILAADAILDLGDPRDGVAANGGQGSDSPEHGRDHRAPRPRPRRGVGRIGPPGLPCPAGTALTC